MKNLIVLFSVILMFVSCKKEPGKGGASKLKGRIVVDEYSVYNYNHVRSYYAADETVYIVYGNNDYYGDRVRTNSDGYYEFSNLQHGEYHVYTYTENEQEDKKAVYADVNIESNGSVVDVPYIKVRKYVSSGTVSVNGSLFVYDYNSDLTMLKDTFYGANRYVYFGLKNKETYLDRVKTNPNGYFKFYNLLPGDYEVYAYSQTNTAAGQIAIKKYFTIDKSDVELSRIEIID